MTKKNINNRAWRTEFNWMDRDDVQLEVLKDNSRIEEGELSPDNKEACELMMALITEVKVKNPKIIDFENDEGEDEDRGIGKDIFGKYAYQDIEFGGKTYQIHLREKAVYDNSAAIAQCRIIGPKLIRNKKGMN
tara:strand:- start:274 stop:675 length:402 start_codon:yes stop_codon:yes gene_type:complete